MSSVHLDGAFIKIIQFIPLFDTAAWGSNVGAPVPSKTEAVHSKYERCSIGTGWDSHLI